MHGAFEFLLGCVGALAVFVLGPIEAFISWFRGDR